MKIEDDLKEIDFSSDPERPAWIKKTIILAAGIFVLVIFLSYLFVTYPIGDIIKGQIESTALQEDTIILPELTIIFENNTRQDLLEQYRQQQKVEFSVCFKGYLKENNYHLTSLYLPTTYRQAFNEVIFEPCSEDTLIMLHSHPYKSCLASAQDLDTLNKTKKNNPRIVMVIMCEPERFSVYA